MKRFLSFFLILILMFSLISEGTVNVFAEGSDHYEAGHSHKSRFNASDAEENSEGESQNVSFHADDVVIADNGSTNQLGEKDAFSNTNDDNSVNKEINGIKDSSGKDDPNTVVPYVYASVVSENESYVIACKEDSIYHVLVNDNGSLRAIDLDELTSDTVNDSMKWIIGGVGGAHSIRNGDCYLSVSSGEITLTVRADTSWDYNAQAGYIDYTSSSDTIYSLNLESGIVSAFSGDLSKTPGNAVFYISESKLISKKANVNRAAKSAEAGPADHYIAVASDRHGNENVIANAMGGMPENVEYVVLDGDMVDSGVYNTSTLQEEVRSGAGLSDATVHVVYASHDSSVNDDEGILKGRNSSGLMYTGYDDDGSIAYYAYCASYSSLTSTSSSDASEFMSWVDQYCSDTSIPIIVIGHVPLHYQRNDNRGAVAWNRALNYAATGEETTSEGLETVRNVIYLHGHNHTSESNKEYYIPAGSTMQIYSSSNPSYIYYTYTTAGYLRDNTAATLIAIDENEITVTKYKNGSVFSTYSAAGAKTDFSSSYDTEASHTIERITDSGKIIADDILIDLDDAGTTPLTAVIEYTCMVNGETVVPDTVTYTVYEDANNVIDSIDESGIITLSGNTGSATVSIDWIYTSDTNKEYSGLTNITVTVRDTGGPSATDTEYEYISEATAGESYVVVSNGRALVNSGGSAGAVDVTIDGDIITVSGSSVDIQDIMWTVTDSGDLLNDGYYLLRQSGTGAKAVTLNTSDSGDAYSDWTYTGDQLTLTGGSNGTTVYYLYYSDGWYTGTSAGFTSKLYGVILPDYDLEWTWEGNDSDGYSSATAVFTNSDDDSDVMTVTDDDIEIEASAPSCESSGRITYTASVTGPYGKTYSATKEIILAPTGHDLIRHEGQTATCTEAGWKEYDTCSRCGYTTYEEIPALGHEYETEVKDPTCTEGGYTAYTCTRCGNSYIGDDTAALGHMWNDGEVTIEPTCTEDGVKIYTCIRCGETKTGTVKAHGHVLEGTGGNDATCEKAGNTAYWTCENCGKFFSDAEGMTEIGKDSWVIEATGHTEGEAVKENEEAATCTGSGRYDETVYCEVCGKELSRETKETPALGHDWESPVWSWDGTDRAEATFICRNDPDHVEVIPADIQVISENGISYYTAVVSFNGAEYIDTKEMYIRYSIVITETIHGNVSADKEQAVVGETVTITLAPEDGYGAGEIKAFSDDGDPVEVSMLDDITCTLVMPADNVTVLVMFRKVRPTFETQSVTLSGLLGVNFFLDLPELAGVDYNDSYMIFTVNGKDQRVEFDPTFMNASKKYYGFTCSVNAVQMAEPITAVFHYGEGRTISKTYSVKEYMEVFDANRDRFDQYTIAVFETMSDYGHYIQPFLANANHWTVGVDFKEMDHYYKTDAYDIEAVKAAVADYAIVRDNNSADIEKINYTLTFDTDTIIRVYFRVKDDYTGAVGFTLNGAEYSAQLQSDGRYLVAIPDIGAHLLGRTYTVIATTDNGTATVSVSGLSYVNGLLGSATDTVTQSAAASLYSYFVAAKAYKDNHQ